MHHIATKFVPRILSILGRRTAYCELQGTSSGLIGWSNLIIQDHYWWWWLWPWDKTTMLPVEKPKLTKTKKCTSEEQSQKNSPCFLWSQRYCALRIHSTKSYSPLHVLMCCFVMAAWKRKMAAWTLETRKLTVISSHCAPSHFLFHEVISDQKQHDCCPSSILLIWFGTLSLHSILQTENQFGRPSV